LKAAADQPDLFAPDGKLGEDGVFPLVEEERFGNDHDDVKILIQCFLQSECGMEGKDRLSRAGDDPDDPPASVFQPSIDAFVLPWIKGVCHEPTVPRKKIGVPVVRRGIVQ
jgi:hypothetical protein